MTELRVDATKTSKPLPAFLLKTFEAYLPYVLGLTGPEHEERVKVATQRFDQYVQSLPPHEGTRDMLAFLIGWCWFQGTFVGRGTAPWNQSPEEREHYVGRLFRSDLRAADSAWTLVRAGIRFLPFVPANVPRASARDLAKSLREMMSLAYYSNPSADPITGYSRIWKRDFLARTDVDVVSLKGLRQPDVFDAAKVASVHHQGHPYDTSGLFACDGRPRVAVIGSGAGGAVVAARLAQAREGNRPKYDVAVFEAGPRLRPSQYPLDTMVGMSQLFEGGLLTLSRDLDIHLLRGRLVGGGTVMTSGLSVKLRPETMRRWTSTSGDLAIGVTWDELEDGFQAVHARQHMGSINPRLYTDASHLLGKGGAALPGKWEFNADNPQNNVMMGADQHPGGRRDQNGDFCIGCGLCNYGCHFGHKLSMDLTYLPDAEAAGARIHQNLPIEAITTERDAHGRVTATHLALGRGLKSRVSVDYVVIAAGAVGSPALLLRSAKKDGGFASLASFQDKRIGSGLGFNYGSGVVAQWPTDFARPGHLGFQIKYVATKAGDPSFDIDLPGGSFPMRYVLENAFVPPGLLSNVVPGIGADHLRWMKAYKRLGMCASTIGSPQTGRVLADRTVIYRLSCGEMDVNRRALASIARLYFAAGAQEVGFAGVRQPTEDGAPDRGMLRADARGAVVKKTFGEMSEDELLQELAGILETPEHIMLSSAHPQGGLAMRSAVGAGCVRDFRLDGTENVFVVDGSIFPSTIVVNPQWTIAALAEVASKRIDNEIASAL